MTDAQMISIAITVLAIFGGVLMNNVRFNILVNDLRGTLRAEAKADKGEIVNMIAELRRIIEANHVATLRQLAVIDQRVTRLEARG